MKLPSLPTMPADMRNIGDVHATRQAIFNNVLDEMGRFEPVANQRYSLQLADVGYEGPEDFSKEDEKRALIEGRTLGRRLRGTWRLSTPDGAVIDQNRLTLASIPYLTSRGTFIINGNDYSMAHQNRLRPGIFTRQKESGELESHVNVAKGYGHRYFLDPETGVFRVQFGQSRVPLLPVLRALGATDSQLRQTWGNEIYAANMQAHDPGTIKKVYQKLKRSNHVPKDAHELTAALRQAFEEMTLDPEVTQRTLGQAFDRVTPDTILAATRKLLDVEQGKAATDDRDAMAYQQTMGPEDIFAERIKKGRSEVNKLLWKATFAGNLQKAPASVFSKAIRGALLDTGLGNLLEEVNPSEILDQMYRTTRMGEGGIGSLDSVPMDSRNVQPSHLGFIDPVHTPESGKIGVDTRLTINTRKGKDGRIYARFLNPKTGKVEWKSPQELADLVVAFPGELESEEPFARAIVAGKLRYVPRDKVDYQLTQMTDGFGPLANLVPMKSAVFPQRASMGSRMTTQALPLVGGEAPFVQAGIPGEDRSFEDLYGEQMGAVRSRTAGTVVDVQPTNIKVKGTDGKTETIDLFNNMPFNRKSVTGDTRIMIRRNDGTIWRGAIADYVWEATDCVLSIDPQSKQTAWKRVTAKIKHANDKKLLRIRTDSGRTVVVTEDHSLVTMGSDGWLTPVYPEDCRIGETRLPVAMVPALDMCDTLSDDMGTLIGLYLAEGHVSPAQPNTVILAVAPPERQAEIIVLLSRLGFAGYVNGGSVCFTDAATAAMLVRECGHGSNNKTVPDRLFNTSTSVRKHVVSGYFAGDACLWFSSTRQLTAVSTSRALRDGMTELLASLSIFATHFDAPRECINDAWHDAYGLRVIGSHIDKLERWFFYDDRQAKLSGMPSITKSSKYELVPTPTRQSRKLLYAGFEEVTNYIYKTACQGAVSKRKLETCTGVYGQWRDADVYWTKIKSIETVQHCPYVYDLCVDESEIFAVDCGLLVHNTFIHNTPTVQVGQQIKPGDLLATSNYTNADGSTALGRNVRVAYVPYKGMAYEDAVVASESFAKKMTSEHLYQNDLEKMNDINPSKKAFISIFPGKYKRDTLEKFDDDGVIKPGSEVNYADPLILAVRQRKTGPRLGRRKRSFADATVSWDHHVPGVVTDVYKGAKGINVIVKASQPMQVGDKIAGRYGDKNILAAIIPDEDMPQDEQGQPFELLLNPLGVISRGNPAQILEAALGKVAALTGKPIKVPDFQDPGKLRDWVEQQLAAAGVKDTEKIFDPDAGRHIPDIMTGNRFIMKLHHMAESKIQGRATGEYSSEEEPSRGGEAGAKRVGMLGLNALLSHGAYDVVQDMNLVRGQKNDDYWRQVMSGYTPPDPKVPMVYTKFINELRAAGINPIRKGTKINVMAMTDKDIDTLTGGRELNNADTVSWKSERLDPVRGGLFDKRLTGGHGGNRWAAIKLHTPLPNPIMEEPIRRLLGLTEKRFRDILAGREEYKGETGSAAIANALENINIDRELEQARNEIKGGRKTYRDAAIRRLGYLKAAKKLGIHPKDWMLSKVPVLPPMFRPVSLLAGSNTQLVADPNYLYKELYDANTILGDLEGKLDDVSDERLNLYDSFKAVVGLGDPIQPALKQQRVRGILKHIMGHSPKFGTVQRKLLGSTVDLVGRTVIAPNPELDMDQVGLPEDKAWTVYKPFIIGRLVKRGMPRMRALDAFNNREPIARHELLGEMEVRPVIIDRAPVLHRYGVMAFWPQLTSSNALQIPPLVTGGFGADFDGDQMNFHVPAKQSAVREAIEKMMPSRNLLSSGDFGVHYLPSQEYVAGLWAASTHRDRNKPVRKFRSKADAYRAYRRGEIGIGQRIEVLEH